MDFLSPLLTADTLKISVILLTLKVAGIATVVSSVLGILTAWCIARRPFPGRTWVDALCALPLVLPPTVIGYYLILLVGRRGLLGPWLAEFGINLMFSWEGAVVAATVVVFPLIYKSARAALEAVDHNLENAARTLGASEWKVFLRVSLPLARPAPWARRNGRCSCASRCLSRGAASWPGSCWPSRAAWASSGPR